MGERPRLRPGLIRVWIEAPVIVASILLAFLLEAWWSEHRERVRAGEYLDAVTREFREGRIQLDTVLLKNERAMRATERMIDLTSADVESLTSTEAENLYWDMMQASTFDPSLGALNSLHTSEAIDAIEDITIRAALDAWPGLVADSREDTEAVMETSLSTTEAWAQRGLTPLMLKIARGTGDSLSVKRFLSAFVEDEIGKNRLASRASYLFLYQREIEGLSNRLDEILRLLEGSAGDRLSSTGSPTS